MKLKRTGIGRTLRLDFETDVSVVNGKTPVAKPFSPTSTSALKISQNTRYTGTFLPLDPKQAEEKLKIGIF